MSDFRCSDRQASLDRLYTALGYKPLRKSWAKCEILLGLFAVGVGISVVVADMWRTLFCSPLGQTAVGISLFTLGGYLAMAGHRSHLYQSNNQLVGYLAELIERRPDSVDGGKKMG